MAIPNLPLLAFWTSADLFPYASSPILGVVDWDGELNDELEVLDEGFQQCQARCRLIVNQWSALAAVYQAVSETTISES